MEHGKQTLVAEFVLLGLSEDPAQQLPLFILFFMLYSVAVLGNMLIITVIITDSQLHSPMYFFICNLSLVDICLTTVTIPKMLASILSGRRSISFNNCITQLYFFVAFLCIESYLLGVMAFDRYVAICNPFHYFQMMNKSGIALLGVGSWITGFLNSLLHTVMISSLSFCKQNLIQNFFCDIPAMLKLSCSDTSTNELLILTEATMMALVSILSIVISYVYIIATILRMPSKEGRRQAFSTCSSHLTVVSLYYGTILFTYIRPTSSYSLEKDKVVSVMYTVVTPMVNPFIYSLRNKQVKGAMRRLVNRHHFFQT
ncbi:olfactory receptor 1G1-like [Ambystoma mexicanum]|uniref:olfactory receptor 1G1-like n=1 Tax=Ambystoma mexicanum TaxID=8296 RepID=UPI0037E8F288